MVFSIIVPMYNVEQYLDKCIQSIVSQTVSDYEVILVNDCSTDRTLEIAQSWKDRFDRIKIINKPKNSGLSDTRNVGMDVSKGDYIVFVDSDDYIENGALEVFYRIINGYAPDIIYAGFIKENEQGVKKHKFGFISESERIYSSQDYMRSELKHRNLFAGAQFGIYRRDMLINNRLYFKSGILHEDEEWTPRVLMKAKSVYLSNNYFYHYLKRDGSITTKKDRTKNGLDLSRTCTELEKYAVINISDGQLLKLYYNQLAKLYMKAMCVGKLYRKEYRDTVDRFFPIRHSSIFFDILKAILFAFSLRLYAGFDSVFGDDWRGI